MTSIKNKVRLFSKGTKRHYRNLKNKPIWLFLSTFGCWGIQSDEYQTWAAILRFIAMAGIAMYFCHLVFKGTALPSNHSYSTYIKELNNDIKTSKVSEKEKKRLLKKVEKVKRKYIVSIKNIKVMFPLWPVSFFWVSSLIIFYLEWTGNEAINICLILPEYLSEFTACPLLDGF